MLPLQLAALCAVCGAVAAPAAANGDPASHYLILDPAYFPAENRVSAEGKRELRQVLAEAKDAGLDVRVALIATQVDLGLAGDRERRAAADGDKALRPAERPGRLAPVEGGGIGEPLRQRHDGAIELGVVGLPWSGWIVAPPARASASINRSSGKVSGNLPGARTSPSM